VEEKEIKKRLEEVTGREENEGKVMKERQKIKTNLTIAFISFPVLRYYSLLVSEWEPG
jgi:hypothetical protein